MSATFDDWSDISGQHYLGLTVHGIDGAALVNDVIAVMPVYGSHTGARVAKWAEDAINKVTDDTVLLAATVADGASNEQLAGFFLHGENAFNSLTCFSHTLELIINAGLDRVGRSLGKLHLILLLIKRHGDLRTRLAELVGDKQLVDDVFADE